MFYERLLLVCEEKGEKFTPLVKKLGYSPGSIKNWKNGTIPSGDIIKSFADYFGITTDYLLGREPSAPSNMTKEEALKFILSNMVGQDVSDSLYRQAAATLEALVKNRE